MSDLIERKEAIEAIKKYGKDALSAGRRTLDQVDDTIELCNILSALPAVDTALLAPEAYAGADGGGEVGGMNMDWISVKDRLPEDDATYLVYGRNWYGIVVAIYYGDGKWLTCDDLTNITRFVTHWMPMPMPPKEEPT